MGSEENGTEIQIQNPTHTQTQQHSNPNNIASPEIHANTSNNQIEITSHYGGDDAESDRHVTLVVHPHSLLPMPVPPQSFKSNENDVVSSNDSNFSVGSFLRQRSSHLSAAIVKRVSSLRQSMEEKTNDDEEENLEVTEFSLSGVKVTVTPKPEEEKETSFKGRISFFSKSNCRDCTAVRRFFKEKGIRYVEINVDVFGERERELRERTGSGSVPQIFFNEKLIGGLVALNSLRNSGEFDRRVAEIVAGKVAGGDSPAPPVYGFDYVEEERADEMVGVVRVLRLRLPIQDRLRRMKMVKNCFQGNELVEALLQNFHCARNEAVEIGKQLSKKHFIHHVFGENDFEEGNHLYRFLEHEPFIPRCFNFHGTTNDSEPKPADSIFVRLTKIMSAILESYASDDRQHVDYEAISRSEEFRRYVNLTQDLQRVNLLELSENEKLAFFLNLYNAMVIHAVISVGCPEGAIDRRSFFSDFQYLVGGHPYSLNMIKNGILRCNRRSPYSLVKPFSTGDKRLEVALIKLNPLLHFGLCNGTKSSPNVRFFTPHRVVDELRGAAREFFENHGIEVDLEKRTVYLTRIFKWFSGDFGQEKEILLWIINYLDPNKAGLVTHLMGDSGPVHISYQNYDWSINS
ncbi:Glutaredoxin [Glycine soja]